MSWFPLPDSSFTRWVAFYNLALPNHQGSINIQHCRCISSLRPDASKEHTHSLQMSSQSLWKIFQPSAPDSKAESTWHFFTSKETHRDRAVGNPSCPNLINFLSSRQEQIWAICFCVNIGTVSQSSLNRGEAFPQYDGLWIIFYYKVSLSG